ncbi:hypothetical protein H5410_015776 [Solanum commersonii]|uniref:Uncharacterized protein n=1 Tax=Solanum commersonii TaxID=4109 RepID=A0A9J5ZUS1_SOLCO|nr:hypothetical protein H5410_015776 [Solanum commersonii]
MQGEQELGSQSNHFFSDGTNLCINQTFSNKNELQFLLAKAATKKSFDFATVKSCTKYLKNSRTNVPRQLSSLSMKLFFKSGAGHIFLAIDMI